MFYLRGKTTWVKTSQIMFNWESDLVSGQAGIHSTLAESF